MIKPQHEQVPSYTGRSTNYNDNTTRIRRFGQSILFGWMVVIVVLSTVWWKQQKYEPTMNTIKIQFSILISNSTKRFFVRWGNVIVYPNDRNNTNTIIITNDTNELEYHHYPVPIKDTVEAMRTQDEIISSSSTTTTATTTNVRTILSSSSNNHFVSSSIMQHRHKKQQKEQQRKKRNHLRQRKQERRILLPLIRLNTSNPVFNIRTCIILLSMNDYNKDGIMNQTELQSFLYNVITGSQTSGSSTSITSVLPEYANCTFLTNATATATTTNSQQQQQDLVWISTGNIIDEYYRLIVQQQSQPQAGRLT